MSSGLSLPHEDYPLGPALKNYQEYTQIAEEHPFSPESSLGDPTEPHVLTATNEGEVIVARALAHNKLLYVEDRRFGGLARQINSLLDQYRAMVLFVEDDSPQETLEHFVLDEYKLIRSWNLECNSSPLRNPQYCVPEEAAYYPLRSAALYAGAIIESLASTIREDGDPALERNRNNVSINPALLAQATDDEHGCNCDSLGADENYDYDYSLGSGYGIPPLYQETGYTNYLAQNSFDSRGDYLTSFAQENHTLNDEDWLDPKREGEHVKPQADEEDQDSSSDEDDQHPLIELDDQGTPADQKGQGTQADRKDQDTQADEDDEDSEADGNTKAPPKNKAPRKKKTGAKHHFIRDSPSINLHMPDPNSKPKTPVEFTIVELMTFIPQCHRAPWMIDRIVWNDVSLSSLGHMIKAHRANETNVMDNALLTSMQGEMRAKLGLAKPRDWKPKHHNKWLKKPVNWNPKSISMAGYEIPLKANPKKQRKATSGVMVGEDPIMFYRLAFNVRHWPDGFDALNLTRCVKYVLDHIGECDHLLFPNDYFVVLEVVGRQEPVPRNADKLCSNRWSGREACKRSSNQDPVWQLECDNFLQQYGRLVGTLPAQPGSPVEIQAPGQQPIVWARVPTSNVATAIRSAIRQAQIRALQLAAQASAATHVQAAPSAQDPTTSHAPGQAPVNTQAPANAQLPGASQGLGQARNGGNAYTSADLGSTTVWRPSLLRTRPNWNGFPAPNHVTNHFSIGTFQHHAHFQQNAHFGPVAPGFGGFQQGYGGHTAAASGPSSSGPLHGSTMGNATNYIRSPNEAMPHNVAPRGSPLASVPQGNLMYNRNPNSGPSNGGRGGLTQRSTPSGAIFNGGHPGFTQPSTPPRNFSQRTNTENYDNGKGKGKRRADDDVPPRPPPSRGGSTKE